jgi:hypothetical protein
MKGGRTELAARNSSCMSAQSTKYAFFCLKNTHTFNETENFQKKIHTKIEMWIKKGKPAQVNQKGVMQQ